MKTSNHTKSFQSILRERMILLDEYDGEKMLFSVDNGLLLIWHLDKENHEEWFCVAPKNENSIKSFLSGKISLLSLMKESKLNIAIRSYNEYDTFEVLNIVPTEKNYTFPAAQAFFTGQQTISQKYLSWTWRKHRR